MKIELDFFNGINARLLHIIEYPLHIHDNIQIIYVVRGEIEVRVSFSRYKLVENDMHIINIGDVHGISCTSNNNVVLVFDIDVVYYRTKFPDLAGKIFISYQKHTQKNFIGNVELAELFSRAAELLNHKKEREMSDKIEDVGVKVISILYERFRIFNIDNIDKKIYMPVRYRTEKTLIDKINTIIEEIYQNYSQKISLAEMARIKYINYHHLSRLIKKNTGDSFQNIVNMVRVEKSEVHLLTTNKPLSVISLDCGFSNPQYYKNHFIKWFGISPDEYRKIHQKKTIKYIRPKYNIVTGSLSDITIEQVSKIVLDAKSTPIMSGKVVRKIIDKFINRGLLKPSYCINSFINILGEEVLVSENNYIFTKQGTVFNLAIFGDPELLHRESKQPLLIILNNIYKEENEITIKQTEITNDGEEIKHLTPQFTKGEKIEHTVNLKQGDIVILTFK